MHLVFAPIVEVCDISRIRSENMVGFGSCGYEWTFDMTTHWDTLDNYIHMYVRKNDHAYAAMTQYSGDTIFIDVK